MAFLAGALTGELLPWESLGSPACAPLVLACLPGVVLELLSLLLMTAEAKGQEEGTEGSQQVSRHPHSPSPPNPPQPSASRNAAERNGAPVVRQAACGMRSTWYTHGLYPPGDSRALAPKAMLSTLPPDDNTTGERQEESGVGMTSVTFQGDKRETVFLGSWRTSPRW